MKRKAVLAIMGAGCLCIILAGCETLKGVVKTMGCTGGCVAQDTVKEGITEDTKAVKNFIVRTDEWFRENLW
ncbi:MAG: hypothetical protein MJA29_12025 [Candidatus Omnitrophica bacterium]|nr:hypothetical protein [Candidatus Omnitrophota bacterium]